MLLDLVCVYSSPLFLLISSTPVRIKQHNEHSSKFPFRRKLVCTAWGVCHFLLKGQTTLNVPWGSQTGVGEVLAEGVRYEMSPCLQHSSSQATCQGHSSGLPRQSWVASSALPRDRLSPLIGKDLHRSGIGAMMSPGNWKIANIRSHGDSESSA